MQNEQAAMRILMVAQRSFPYMGGLETHVHEVATRLTRASVDLTILSSDPGGRLPSEDWSGGVRTIRARAWPADRDYYFAPKIYHITRQQKWDLIHCQAYHTLVPPLAMLAAIRTGTPYIVTLHSGKHSFGLRERLRPLQWMLLRPLLGRAKRLIAVSEFEARIFQERLRLPAERFVVIPNGADLPAPAVVDTPPTPKEGLLLLSVGRLERYKGHHRVLAALPKVLEAIPNVRLRIAGSGPYQGALEQQVHNLGLEKYVDIQPVPGSDRQAMASLLASADLVTLISEYESHGIAALEAVVARRPVLVADTTALHDLAVRGFAQSIPIDCSDEELSQKIVEQLRCPSIPKQPDLPTWDRCAAQLLDIYRSILQQEPHA